MPRTIVLTPHNTDEAAAQAAVVLRAGGVVLYPTDTLYGLAADALSRDALEKIYTIKGRDEGKPIHSVFSSLEAASPVAEITKPARRLADTFLPGKLTLLLQKKPGVPDWATSGHETFGIRVPKDAFCLALARDFGRPYTATSANRSGEVPERSVDRILIQIGGAAGSIDLIIDAGEIPESAPTTVVDASSEEIQIIRVGAIAEGEIVAALQAEQ